MLRGLGLGHGKCLWHAAAGGVRRGWNDKELKTLSARVLRAVPNDTMANFMRACVVSGEAGAWEVGPRSAAELKEAAAHWDRTAALSNAPALKAQFASAADACRGRAQAI